jgi:hypothetical protein
MLPVSSTSVYGWASGLKGWKVGIKAKFDPLYYTIWKINYFHTAGIKQTWNTTTSTNAGLPYKLLKIRPWKQKYLENLIDEYLN